MDEVKPRSFLLQHDMSVERPTSNALLTNNIGNDETPVYLDSWPNVAEGRRLRVLKNSTNESFAQKVQAGASGIGTSGIVKVAEKLRLGRSQIVAEESENFNLRNKKSEENVTSDAHDTVQELGVSDAPNHYEPKASLQNSSVKTDKKNKRVKKPKKIQLQDSHVCLIDGKKREEWFQLEPVKNAVPYKCPELVEENFPDLTSALKFSLKCTPRQEFEESVGNEVKSYNSSPQFGNVAEAKGQKFKKKQPRRKDPISVNIIDIIKELDSCIRISPKNLQKIKTKDNHRKTLGGNFLDSSNPVRKRGKHREAGPRKKISKLKQIILSERMKKQEPKALLARDFSLLPGEPFTTPSINSVCDGIVSLKIIDSTNASCGQLFKNSVNHSNKMKTEQTLDCLIPDLISDNSDKNLEISNSVIPAVTSYNASPPNSPGNVTVSLQLNKLPSTLHSRKFRDYCDNIRSKALDEAVTKLLKAIYGFQDRHYQKDPIRAHAKRRFVLGIREVKKFLMLKKLRCIVIAPDLEPVKSPGGLDETVIQIREEGRTQEIPVVFALGRRQLGFSLMRKVPISIVGIISPQGAEDLFQEVLNQWQVAVDIYQQKVSELDLCSELQ